ncbi:MAG: MT-A70 family methyltransferase [Pseudomonadota bacterium]
MKYGCILMDPPWAFKTYSGRNTIAHRSANDHYRTMDLHQIAGLPVSELAARDCALFMWVVDSHLDAALDLFKVWGFKFKTRAFTWVKTGNIGMGYWTRKQSEMCLLATRGKPRRKSKGVREIIEAPRREHSRKPDEQYARIEALVGGPYLEMFARQERPGWSAWGNETTKFNAAADVRAAAD